MPTSSGNVADLILDRARAAPDRLALVVPVGSGGDGREEVITYGGLARRIERYRAGLERAGFRPGDRVMLLFPVSIDFYALSVALLASGITLVLLDGAMGARRVLAALRTARAKGIVSVAAMLKLWPLLPPTWRARRFSADGPAFGARPLDALLLDADDALDARLLTAKALPRRTSDEGLLTFTSGTSGKPKGVDRTHGVLAAQYAALVEAYPHDESDVYMTCFPALALHNLCCGITTILPPVDLRRPATIVPARALAAMRRWRVNLLSAAPAFLERIVLAMAAAGETLPAVRGVGAGGAPVSRRLCRGVVAQFPSAEALVLYGSTEAEPIGSAEMRAVVSVPGRGFLVGREARATELALVTLPDAAPPLDARGLAPYAVAEGAAGEVVVRGAHVPRQYLGNDDANCRFKLAALDGTVWHRTGDLARRDGEGRLWLLGRRGDTVVHRGRDRYPFEIEAAALDVNGVWRAALVAHARAPEGELAVQLAPDAKSSVVSAALGDLLAEHEMPAVAVRVLATIPMDARHESKVERRALAAELER